MRVSHLPSQHRRAREVFVVTAAVSLLCGTSGCRLVRGLNPVPEEQAAARRLCNQGLSAADQEDLVRAETLLERAVKACPTDVDARQHYADVLWKRGSKVEAVAQINKAIELSPGDVDLSIQAGRMYLELGLLDDADRLSDEAVLNAPQSAGAWHLHGQVALARGRPDEALGDFHRALAAAPDDRGVLLDTAEVYRRLDRPQRALATLAILGETYGPHQIPPEVLVMEGMAQEALGRRDDALASYRRAIERGDASPQTAARIAALADPTSRSSFR